jgi:hypothetical protein
MYAYGSRSVFEGVYMCVWLCLVRVLFSPSFSLSLSLLLSFSCFSSLPTTQVRQYAVGCLHQLSDVELVRYMIQLVGTQSLALGSTQC